MCLDLRARDPPHHLCDDVVLPGVRLRVDASLLRLAEAALLRERRRQIGGQGRPEVHVADLHEHAVSGPELALGSLGVSGQQLDRRGVDGPDRLVVRHSELVPERLCPRPLRARLTELAAHGEQHRERAEDRRGEQPIAFALAQEEMCPVDRGVDRRRPELDRLHQRPRGAGRFASVPCTPGVLERVFERGRALAPAARVDRRLAQEVPRPRDAAVVAERLEGRNRLLRDARDLLRRRFRVREDPEELALDQRA